MERGGGSRRLKVFRTPIGFHDAYVAAPSMKAALEAWGSSTNLFSQGAAEVVTDPDPGSGPGRREKRRPIEQALARPGEVVRVLRGNEGEQIRALGKTGKGTKKEEAGPRIKSGVTKKKQRPRPSAAGVERAEAALARVEAKHRAALDKLRAEAAALDKRRRELERKQRSERERLNRKLEVARERYRSAMDEWAG
jgi:hypothetical protein